MHLTSIILSSALFLSGAYVAFLGWRRLKTPSKKYGAYGRIILGAALMLFSLATLLAS